MESILLKITPCLLDAGRLREAVAGISQEFMLMRDYTVGVDGGVDGGGGAVGDAVMAALIGFDQYFGSGDTISGGLLLKGCLFKGEA